MAYYQTFQASYYPDNNDNCVLAIELGSAIIPYYQHLSCSNVDICEWMECLMNGSFGNKVGGVWFI